jgi:hypothetical protein
MSDRFRFRPEFKQALHDAKVADVKKQYAKKPGYLVKEHYELETGVYVDIYIETPRTQKNLMFEVIVHPISPNKQTKVDKLLEISTRLGYEFRTVSVILPVTPGIEIEWFNKALFNYFVETQQDFLARFPTHACYEELEGDIQSITISSHEKSVYVYGDIEVRTPFGSNSDMARGDGLESGYRFPYEGKFFLNFDQEKIERTEKLLIDDSAW